MENTVELKLTKYAVSSLWSLLTTTPVKGSRVEMRKHGGVMKALKNPVEGKPVCMARQESPDPNADGWNFQEGGILTLKGEYLEYLEDILDDMAERGVPGNLGQGYAELIEEIERVNPPEKDDAKKK